MNNRFKNGLAGRSRRLLSILIPLMLGQPQLSSADEFAINAGLAGAWANPATPGQGLFFDIDPTNRVIFLTWFTFVETDPQATSIIGHPGNRWFVAMGSYSEGSSALTLDLVETQGGIFDNPAAVTSLSVGSLNLNFRNCSEALMEFVFDDRRAQGQVDLTRLSSAEVCEVLAEQGDSGSTASTLSTPR